MRVTRFAHLSVRSIYSFREGAVRLDELAARTAAMGMDAVAITDTDNLYGAVRFAQACAAHDVKPVFGARVTYESRGGLAVATLLARDLGGYANLCRLLTRSHRRGLRSEREDPPRATFAEIAAHAEGLFCLLGPESDVGAMLARRAHDAARAALAPWLEAFCYRHLFLEVRNLLEPRSQAMAGRALALARETRVPAVATNGVRAPTRAEAFVCDALDAMRKLVPLAEHHRDSRNHEAYLKPPEEMAALFGGYPDLLANAARIAEQCEVDLALGTPKMPAYPLPRGASANELLARRCFEGLARRGLDRGPRARAARERLDAELAMTARLGFAGYFLTVSDIAGRIRAMGIRSACRGSAAGSLICYLTGVSDVDPIEHDLLFERFVNPSRANELPDVDIDVESARREDVYRDILGAFPSEQVGCAAMIDTYRARGAIREAGKALGFPEGEVDGAAKAFPHIGASRIRDALEHLPELRGSTLGAGQLSLLFAVAERLDGFPRHAALHPSGVLIVPGELAAIAPLERSAQGFRMAQLDKDDCEALGLLKLDVLGVRMLSAMTHATAEIERTTGERPGLDAIPRDDPAAFELMRASRTLGCFQIESPGQRELLGKLQPDRWQDLIVDISLFRPGPVRSDMVSPYLQRRAGFERPVYAHPSLRPFLAETFGVIVFHEQVMRAIAVVTGIGLAQTDLIRRALEEPENMPDLERFFYESGRANGWRDDQIAAIWHEVSSFAAFGFCKAHAAAFAVPTYQSAWLKAHHPAAFFAGVLTHEPGMYPRRALLDDARHEGVEIRPLDVRHSDRHYTVESSGSKGFALRIGLMHTDGISDTEIDRILAARAEHPFRSLRDFCRRTGVSRPVAENLIHAGALDAFGNRRDLLLEADELRGHGARDSSSEAVAPARKGEPRAQPAQLAMALSEPPATYGLRAYSAAEKVRAELEVTGMDTSRHVVSFYTDALRALGVTPAAKLRRHRQGARVMVAGVKVASQTPAVRSGQRIIFVTLDDSTGLSDSTIFESVQQHCAAVAFHSWLMVIRGTIRRAGARGISINAERAWDLVALARAHREGRLDVAALWEDGVEEIERTEAQRRAAARAGRKPPAPPPAAAPPPPVPLHPEGLEAPPRRLWHASGGSAGA